MIDSEKMEQRTVDCLSIENRVIKWKNSFINPYSILLSFYHSMGEAPRRSASTLTNDRVSEMLLF